jgi:fatty-acyl-CoA synthase
VAATSATSAATVAGLVDAQAALAADAHAAWFPDARLSYAELAESSLRWARRLRAAGVRSGDRVGLLLAHASEESVSLALGAMRIGAIIVPVNARYHSEELTYVTNQAGISLLVTAAWFDDRLAQADVPAGCRIFTLGGEDEFFGGEDRVAVGEIRDLERRVSPNLPARIIYTSGTTAHPKGCVHTHAALIAQAEAVAERLRLTREDRYWTPLPMFHTAGWTMLAAFARGACFHHAGRFEPDASLRQIESERCTVLFPGFETIWMAVLTHPHFDDADLSAVRLILNVGIPERLRLMQEKLPHAPQVSNTGSTESSGWLAIGKATDSLEARMHTCGRPLTGMEVRIINPNTGADAPDGTPGELLFRGPCRLLEYYGDPAGTAAAIDADGWFHSGDLLRREPDGNLVFLSRLKDMLKVGGENVAAAEIEGLLLKHPDVLIAQVVAAPDTRYTEVPAAFVQLKPGAEIEAQQLIDFCAGQIATFKVPRYVRFVDQWPMSGTKIKKVDLREAIATELRSAGHRPSASRQTVITGAWAPDGATRA